MASSSSATIVGFPASPAKLTEGAIEWAKRERHLSRETLEKLRVGGGTAYFPELKSKSEAVFFQRGDGWKARAFPVKAFTSKTDTRASFWNIEAVLNSQ